MAHFEDFPLLSDNAENQEADIRTILADFARAKRTLALALLGASCLLLFLPGSSSFYDSHDQLLIVCLSKSQRLIHRRVFSPRVDDQKSLFTCSWRTFGLLRHEYRLVGSVGVIRTGVSSVRTVPNAMQSE